MVNDALFIGVLNLVVGLLIILIPGMLRLLVGGYFLLSGLLMVLLYAL